MHHQHGYVWRKTNTVLNTNNSIVKIWDYPHGYVRQKTNTVLNTNKNKRSQNVASAYSSMADWKSYVDAMIHTHIYNILINIVMYIILHIVTIYFAVVYMLSLLCAFYVQADTEISCNGARIAQLVQHPTLEKGIILMWVSVPDAARDFSPRVNCQCRLSYGVRTAPAYSRMHQHLWAC